MRTYLGVDSGGSRSRWAVLSSDGEWNVGTVEDVSIQVSTLGVDLAVDRIRDLLDDLTERRLVDLETPTLLGLAGAGSRSTQEAMEARLNSVRPRLRVVGDTLSAAASALSGAPGVAVFAGTGSFAVARARDGALCRVGGRGPLLSDHGGGYWIVREVLQHLMLVEEGLSVEPPAGSGGSALLERIRAEITTHSTRELASCFPLVVAAAAEGDSLATLFLDEGAAHLAQLAGAAARRAELAPFEDVPLFLGGGTLLAVDYRRRIERELSTLGFAAHRVQDAPLSPACGAALLARAWHEGTAPLCRWSTDG